MVDWVTRDLGPAGAVVVRAAPPPQAEPVKERVRVAAGPDGAPEWQACLLLSSRPGMTDRSIQPLIVAMSFRLGAVLPVPNFVQGLAKLCRGRTVLGTASFSGVSPRFVITGTAEGEDARAMAAAVRGASSDIKLALALDRPKPAQLPPVGLDELLRSARPPAPSVVALNPDGTLWSMPALRRGPPPGDAAAVPPVSTLVAQSDQFQALPASLASGTVAHPSPAALIPSAEASVAVGPHASLYLASDSIAHLSASAVAGDDGNVPTSHLPMLANAGATIWPDAIDATQGWYAPALSLVLPNAGDAPGTASFLMTFSSSAPVVVSGGIQSGLRASLRLTVRGIEPPAMAAAATAAKIAHYQPVAFSSASVSLVLPYRQAGNPAVQTQKFTGSATVNGQTITASFDLLDDWARLVYAGLAYPPPAGTPAPSLVVDYAFFGYTRTRVSPPHGPPGGPPTGPPVVGPGQHHLPEAATTHDLPKEITTPILVRDRLAVAAPTTFVQFAREAPGVGRSVPAIASYFDVNAIKAPITVAAASSIQWVWTVRSAVREETIALSLPCGTFGALYRQETADGSVAIGCQDSLKLGQTGLKAWEEMEALTASAYRVYRSLQQPSRFLVLPLTYRIGRYAATAGDKAFKPTAMLYGIQDPDPAKTSYTLSATLVPDIQPGDLARLRNRLASLSLARDAPSILFPTEPGVAAQISFSWVVPSDWPAPAAVAVPDGLMFALTVSTNLALLMLAMVDGGGLQGAASFSIGDGTVLAAAIAVDGTAAGPADTGPVTAALNGSRAVLTNRSAQAMQVADAVVLADGGEVGTVAVDASLAPGASVSVAVGPGSTAVIADARQAAPLPLTEMDIYVQEVTTTVTFIGQITFGNHALSALAIKARLKGTTLEQTATLAENATAQVSFTGPITAYLQPRTMEYALIETRASGTTVTAWREWDLNKSIIVGVTADQL